MLLGVFVVGPGALPAAAARAANPLYDLTIAKRPTFWVAACAGIIVFGSLMGIAFVNQQYLQNVLDYSSLDAGLAILPAVVFMVIVAPRRRSSCSGWGRARRCSSARPCWRWPSGMFLLWGDNSPYWQVAIPLCLMGRASVSLGRRPRTRSPGRSQSGPGSAWHRAPPTSSATSAARS